MQIKFGYTFDDKRKLTKNVNWSESFECKPYTDYNISAPTLLIVDGTGAITNHNYAYIADYSRYYFVDSVTIGRNGMYIVQLSIDVLMTYADGIKNINATISRQENIGINDIVDSLLPLQNRKELAVIEFASSEFNIAHAGDYTYNFVLNVSGGGSGQTSGGSGQTSGQTSGGET